MNQNDSKHKDVHTTAEFQLRDEHIALCDLLKLTGIADSGGQGKQMVADGLVKVDDQIELRKTAKIRGGQTVECLAQKIRVISPFREGNSRMLEKT